MCSQCQAGEELISPCRIIADTQCKPCKAGWYSPNRRTCFPCTQCLETEVEIVRCTNITNRVCSSKSFKFENNVAAAALY